MHESRLLQERDTVEAMNLGAGVTAFTTFRTRGFSQAPWQGLNLGSHVGDDPQAVAANRALLLSMVPKEPQWLDQVHGVAVFDADAPRSDVEGNPRGEMHGPVPTADAAVTTRVGEVLAILTADCLPIVLYDAQARVLGVAHAGWRGLAAGVLSETVAAMRTRGAQTEHMVAWIGPCISASAYQVDQRVRRPFLEMDASFASYFRPEEKFPERWRADLPGLAESLLRAAGLHRVRWCGLCTSEDAENRFYSHRRDGRTGRQATVAWMTV